MANQQPDQNTASSQPHQDKKSVTHQQKVFKYNMPRYIKYLFFITGGLVFISAFLYILSQAFGTKHHFDKDSAVDFVKITSSVLEKHKHTVSSKGIDSIRSDMAKALSSNNFQTVNIERFKNSVTDSTYGIAFNKAEEDKLIGEINSLRDTNILRYDHCLSYVEKSIGPQLFEKYSLYQFLTTNNFWNDMEDPSKYALLFFGVLLLATSFIAYQNEVRQHRHFVQRVKYDAALNTSADITESWITAQTMLDAYHQRNLDQNNWTFRLSVIVMGIGFVIIFYGIHKAIGLNVTAGPKGTSDASSLIAVISTASGVIVNLIGGTFLAIYNSTLKQAIDYTNSLQKTSTVGTSLAILRSIELDNQSGQPDPATADKLIDAKIAIAKQLIGVPAV